MFYRIITITLSILVVVEGVQADLIEYPWFGFQFWTQDVESYNTIDFTGFPNETFITNQYQSQGVLFTNTVFIRNLEHFSDEWGLTGINGIRIEFDSPQYWIAVHHLGVVTFELSYQGKVIATSSLFSSGPGLNLFAGVISDQPFDEVYLFRPQPPFEFNIISIDNLYWGAPIPAPGALGLFALAALGYIRRRR